MEAHVEEGKPTNHDVVVRYGIKDKGVQLLPRPQKSIRLMPPLFQSLRTRMKVHVEKGKARNHEVVVRQGRKDERIQPLLLPHKSIPRIPPLFQGQHTHMEVHVGKKESIEQAPRLGRTEFGRREVITTLNGREVRGWIGDRGGIYYNATSRNTIPPVSEHRQAIREAFQRLTRNG
eukprot:gb/GECG01002742.1/.p1 GENE.gb/GECG01002742.1/~~gb/GECG01002742.1/.p1  ORF type:complete len:176 (+),score=15.11 gb/GECG01002742.1/:1-528(+)